MPSHEENMLRQALQQGAEQAPDLEQQNKLQETPDDALDHALTREWEKALDSESYEETSEALGDLRALRQWRAAASTSRFKNFYYLFEQVSQLEKSELAPSERAVLKDELIGRLTGKAHGQSPRVADLYRGLLSELEGTPYTPQFETTAKKIESLRASGDLSALVNPNVPFEVKLNRLKTRLEGDLMGRRALDKRDKKIVEPQEGGEDRVEVPPIPPPASEESKPGMNEMDRTPEGEIAPAIWTITPAWGGYYKGRSYDRWNAERNVWQRESPKYSTVEDLQSGPSNEEGELHMRAMAQPRQWTQVDVPYTHRLAGASAESGRVQVVHDENGDHALFVESSSEGTIPVSLFLALRDEPPVLTQEGIPEVPNFGSQLYPETIAQIEQIGRRKKGNLPRARSISRLVMQRLKYSNDSSFNAVYDSHPGGYIAAIDEHRQADCDVGNTYFAAACAALSIPVRHVTGHMVKGKDEEGNSRITSGTGHAWSEVWDEETSEWVKVGKEWIRIDATPPGDPQLDEEEKQKGEAVPGDYGSQEELGPTDEQLKAIEEKLANLAEQLQYTHEERQLAEATGIELKEARDISREIAQAEETRLPNGERIVDVLSQLFNLIVETRKILQSEYTGPIRRREGGEEIQDIVGHYIGNLGGDADPASRQMPYEKPKEERIFGGFDVFLIGDKSGSMSNTVEGEPKWQMQRRAEYLLLASLHRFEQNLERLRTHLPHPLAVRTSAISFRNDDLIDEDKPLSGEFQPSDKVRLWRSLTTQGSGNGDSAALAHVYEQIKDEEGEDKLRLVIACTDGYPDDVAQVHQYAEMLGKKNATVVGVGLTETARAVEQIYTTEFSRGVVVRDINDLPIVVAKHLVTEAIKLFPERGRKLAERQIATILSKFGQLL